MPTDHPLRWQYELTRPHRTVAVVTHDGRYLAMCTRHRTCGWRGRVWDDPDDARLEGMGHEWDTDRP